MHSRFGIASQSHCDSQTAFQRSAPLPRLWKRSAALRVRKLLADISTFSTSEAFSFEFRNVEDSPSQATPECGCRQHSRMDQIFKGFSVPADGTGLPTLNEAEISVRLRFMGSYRGKLHRACPCVPIWR